MKLLRIDTAKLINVILSSIKIAVTPTALGSLALWIMAGMFSWAFLIVTEIFAVGKGDTVSWEIVCLAFKVALFPSLMGGTLLATLCGLNGTVWPKGKRWRFVFVALIGALIVPWSFEVADFLSSGNAVKGHKYLWAIRIGLFLSAELFFGAVMAWQLRVSSRLAPGIAQRKPNWLDYGLLFAPGFLGVGSLMWIINTQLDAYHRLAEMLVFPLLLITTTTLAAPLQRLRRPMVHSLVAMFGIAILVIVGSFFARNNHQIALSRGSKTAGLTIGMLGLYNPGWVSRIDISGMKGTICEAPRYSPIAAPVPVDRNKVKNVILISIDALRADAIDWVTPDGRPVMPNLYEFSKKSLVYRNAVTSYPSTAYSIASMVTGLSPSRIVLSPKRPENFFTKTCDEFDNQFVVIPKIGFFKARISSELYFQKAESIFVRYAPFQNEELKNQLKLSRAKKERTLTWIHYFEPHRPFKRHLNFDFGRDDRGRYMGELAYVDSQFGNLAKYLQEDGWLDDSIVILFSDHGEALGEHGYRGHNIYLDSWITDIAMMIRAPGISPGNDNHLRSIADIAPTIQHFAGVDVQEDISGRSLFAEPEQGRFVVGEAFPFRGKEAFGLSNGSLKSIKRLQRRIDKLQNHNQHYRPRVSYVDDNHRLIVIRDSGEISLYDRKADPQELNDLTEQEPELVNSILKTLSEWHAEKSKQIYCGFKETAPK